MDSWLFGGWESNPCLAPVDMICCVRGRGRVASERPHRQTSCSCKVCPPHTEIARCCVWSGSICCRMPRQVHRHAKRRSSSYRNTPRHRDIMSVAGQRCRIRHAVRGNYSCIPAIACEENFRYRRRPFLRQRIVNRHGGRVWPKVRRQGPHSFLRCLRNSPQS